MNNRIVYFELLKDLPGCPAGASFSVVESPDESYIFHKDLRFPVYYAVEYLDWFKPVTEDEYKTNFKNSFIYYAMNDKGCTKEEAEKRWVSFNND